MTQYHYLDDSGGPSLSQGSSSHFALAMVGLTSHAPLCELAAIRQTFRLPLSFEFKFHTTTPVQKGAFFESIRGIPFFVRAVVVDKTRLDMSFANRSGQEFTVEFIARLTLRASKEDIASDVLIIDAATPALRRALRVRLSEECRKWGRVHPFKKIVGGDSRREDGLQLADMIVGAIRHHIVGVRDDYYQTFADKVIDLWRVPG